MGVLTRVWYVLLFILIMGLVFYDDIWWAEYKLSERGIERETQFFGKIINISKDHFYLYTGPSNVKIESSNIPDVRKTRYGEIVVHVISKKDRIVEGINYHNYDYNYLLYIVSFFAFVIFVIIFFKEWKLTLKGFENA